MQFKWRQYRPARSECWIYSQNELERLAEDNRISFNPLGQPSLKKYLHEQKGVEIGLTWTDISNILPIQERTTYPAQMPVALLERVIQIGTNPNDLVLDPFFGSGTTLIAAQTLGRRWWGIDQAEEARQVTRDRLLNAHGLQAQVDYGVYRADEIQKIPPVDIHYKSILFHLNEVAELQKELDAKLANIAQLTNENERHNQTVLALTDSIHRLQQVMNIPENEDDDQDIQDTVRKMEDWITQAMSLQPDIAGDYIECVSKWLVSGWDDLHENSKTYLPQAELLYETIEKSKGQDFSPFIIQYCRALENELLRKLFIAYGQDLQDRGDEAAHLLDLKQPRQPQASKSSKEYKAFLADRELWDLAKSLKDNKYTHTLGSMPKIMGKLRAGGSTLQRSPLLQDFRYFALRYFKERILEDEYLKKIESINRDFRCKAAHPYLLNIEAARQCRESVRTCLNELILNYQST